MPTVREIADYANVSTSTVSLVLNNKPGVSPKMRDVVLNAINEINSRLPNFSNDIEQIALNRTHIAQSGLSILVLHPPILESSYVFREVFRGIQSAADEFGVQLRLIANSPEPTDHHAANIFITDAALRPSGILIFGARRHEPIIDDARRFNIPCVVLGCEASRYPVSGIERDEVQHAFDATYHLIKLGHERIAFIGGNLDSDYDFAVNRTRGYLNAMEHAELNIEKRWVQSEPDEQSIRALLDDITAMILVNDSVGEYCLPFIEASERRIPEDIAVVSFDDTDFARNHTPPLTSVSFYHFHEGQWAVKMLLDHIQVPYLERHITTFGACLVERASTLSD